MVEFKGRLAALIAALFAAAAATSCTTVIRSHGVINENAGSEEREALGRAVADLAETRWPKPTSSSFAAMLAGGETAGERVSRGDAIDAYVALLLASQAAEETLIADAERHLGAARSLSKAAADASDSPSPRLSDVALMEAAIADLRETKSIYAASIKAIDGDDDEADKLKDGFDRVIKELGEVADDLAKSAMKKNLQSFAKSGAVAEAPAR